MNVTQRFPWNVLRDSTLNRRSSFESIEINNLSISKMYMEMNQTYALYGLTRTH